MIIPKEKNLFSTSDCRKNKTLFKKAMRFFYKHDFALGPHVYVQQ